MIIIPLILILFGVLIELEKASLKTLKVTYGGESSPVSLATSVLGERSSSRDVAWHTCTKKRSGAGRRECTISFRIDQKLRGPLQVYYGVENLFQNNLIYSTSASYPQLSGEHQDKDQLRIPCAHAYLTNPADLIYWPCGLIANTMFTDRFEVLSPGVTMSERGISWPTDADHVFRNPPSWKFNTTIPGYVFVDQKYADSPYAKEFAREGLEDEVLVHGGLSGRE